jgi:hypothetical protein
MASYEKTVPVIAETYPGERIWTGCGSNDYFIPSQLSDKVYISNGYSPPIYSGGSVLLFKNRAYFKCDTKDIPSGKTIKKIKYYVYSRYSYSIPLDANDRSFDLSSGWNTIEVEGDDYLTIEQLQDYGGCTRATHAEIDSHLGANKPYAVVTYEDTPPSVPTSLYPYNTTVNARNVIRFSWVHRSKEGLKQKGFTLQYSKDGGSTWTTVTQTTANQYYDLPANTLPLTGQIMWRVKTIDGNGLESNYANGKFSTEVIPQKAPILSSPISGYLDGSKEIIFKWNFLGGTAEDKQNKYDLQYSLNQGSTWTTITKTSTNEQHTISGDTFKSGNVYWRVRTYNAYGDVSPYSEVGSFYVINSPPIPQITDVTNCARPLISWNSVEQQIYELQILKDDKIIFETGTIPSTDRSYRIEDYLEDGEYIAKLRVTNEYSLTSPFAEFMFIIETAKPVKPVIAVYNEEHSVTIKTDNTTLKTLVYRDNKCIGELTDNCFIDYTGENNREYRYFIRAIDKNDNFSDSDIKTGKCRFKDNTLALADNPGEFIKLRYRFNDAPKKVNRIGNIGSLVYFDGREYPATEFTEFKEYSKTLSFSSRTKKELDDLIDLIDKKQTLLYRDIEGENIYGTILSIDYEKAMFGYNVDFTITKTSDYYD